MLKIQKDSRQMPKSPVVTSSSKYYDILYGYLQDRSFYDGQGERYLPKSEISYSGIAKDLKISRQTASSYFKALMELGLIRYDENEKKYYLTMLSKDLAALIPAQTLRILVNTLSKNCISTYVYLLNRFIANGERPFQVTLAQIKGYIGISLKSHTSDDVVNDILMVLEKLELLKKNLVSDGQKFHIWISSVSNQVQL